MRSRLPLHLLPALMAAAEKIGARVEIVGERAAEAETADIMQLVRNYEPEKVEVFYAGPDHLNEPWRRRNRHLNRKSRKSP